MFAPMTGRGYIHRKQRCDDAAVGCPAPTRFFPTARLVLLARSRSVGQWGRATDAGCRSTDFDQHGREGLFAMLDKEMGQDGRAARGRRALPATADTKRVSAAFVPAPATCAFAYLHQRSWRNRRCLAAAASS
jgi:hypothetical protein